MMLLRGTHDLEGTPIEVGDLVAYNMAGDVVRGRVVGVPDRYQSKFKVHLLSLKSNGAPVRGLQPGHISHVRSPTSMLVLKKA